MKSLQELVKEEQAMSAVYGLTNVFEGLASMRIAQVKDQVLRSQQFFDELWQIYSQIHIKGQFGYGREAHEKVSDKVLYIAVTSEGSFSGDIDQKLINLMLQDYDPDKQDIVIIGHHGALQLVQAGVKFKRYFKLPVHDSSINVAPLIDEVKQYKSSTVFYQTYVTLTVQNIKRIELHGIIEEASKQVGKGDEIISEETYIFEPSAQSVASHLESTMLQIALTQTILESKLAQYASRFRSMSSASERASDQSRLLHMEYNRSRRFLADERLKEVINGLRKVPTL